MRRRASASIDELAALIASGCRCVFITGAGLSAASGIPTFRGASDSVWSMTSAAKGRRAAFLRDPLKWYNDFWLANFPHSFTQCQPNAGHEAIAAVAAAFASVSVITQNVDALHQQTSTQWPHDERLVEVHGRLGLYKCVHGGCRYAERDAIPAEALLPDGTGSAINGHAGGRDGGSLLAAAPICPGCGQPVPPMALMFDEQYESHNFYAFQKALDWMTDAAVFVFVGTSYAVTITTLALDAARERRIPVFDFNLHPSLKASPALDVRSVGGPAEIALPQLVEKLRLVTRSRKPVTSFRLIISPTFEDEEGGKTGILPKLLPRTRGKGTSSVAAASAVASVSASSGEEDEGEEEETGEQEDQEETEMAAGAEAVGGKAAMHWPMVNAAAAVAAAAAAAAAAADAAATAAAAAAVPNVKLASLNNEGFTSIMWDAGANHADAMEGKPYRPGYGEQSPQKRPRVLSAGSASAAESFRFGFELESSLRGGGGGSGGGGGGACQLPSGKDGDDGASCGASSDAAGSAIPGGDGGGGEICGRKTGMRYDLDPILPAPLGRDAVRAVLSSRFSRRAHPDPEVEARVEQLWQEQVQRDGRVFNGSKFRLAGYQYAPAAAAAAPTAAAAVAAAAAGSATAPAAATAFDGGDGSAAFAGGDIAAAAAGGVAGGGAASNGYVAATSSAATSTPASSFSSEPGFGEDLGAMEATAADFSAARRLTLQLSLTDYRAFRGTNWSPEAARLTAAGCRDCGDGGAYLAQKLGVGAVVELADGGNILLIRRSRHVAEGKGAVDVPGGHPEPERLKLNRDLLESLEARAAAGGDSGGSASNGETAVAAAEAAAELARLERACVAELFDSVLDEIVDETNIPRSQISDPLLLGIVAQKNSAGAPSAAFWVRCALPAKAVLEHYREGPKEAFETTGLIVASAAELEQAGVEKWFQGKGLEPTPSCEGAIELWLRQRRKRAASPVK